VKWGQINLIIIKHGQWLLVFRNCFNFVIIFFSDRSTNIANLIQPSLGQLQRNLDEFMDTIEPLQGTILNI